MSKQVESHPAYEAADHYFLSWEEWQAFRERFLEAFPYRATCNHAFVYSPEELKWKHDYFRRHHSIPSDERIKKLGKMAFRYILRFAGSVSVEPIGGPPAASNPS